MALALWLAPASPRAVEHAFSEGVYPRWQSLVTRVSNLVPVAGLDLLTAAAATTLAWALIRGTRGRASRSRRVLDAGLASAAAAGVLAIWFLLSWGLNYRRVPLAARLDHDVVRVDQPRLRWLADLAVGELNRLHAEAHATPWPADAELVARLSTPFETALRLTALPPGITPGRPKVTLFAPYLTAAGIAGFTNPLTLDVVITPDALPFEQPALLLHEWAHLAGLAHEAEAGFLRWLAGMHGDAQARYSAWLDLFPRLHAALPRPIARDVMEGLGEGPRADYRAIDDRLRRVRPKVRDFAWAGYDEFLQANRVSEGIRSYDGVVGLVAGTDFDADWRPRLR